MKRLISAFVAGILGGACSLNSTRATAPEARRVPEHGAPPREPEHGTHAHAHAHDQGHTTGGPHHDFADAEALTRVFDDPARDEWQRPEDVLRALELEPGMTVADIGAGTGYFAVRLARAVPHGEVIATDVEPNMVRFLTERAQRQGLTNLRALQTAPNDAGLASSSVDRILIVNVWHHLAQRVDYAKGLAAALRPGGRVLVVDFSLSARRGPPANMRLSPRTVVDELEAAGLSAKLLPSPLNEQYLVEARRQP